MSRGLSEDEAVGMIVRGFLDVGIKGLPKELENDLNETIDKIGKHAMWLNYTGKMSYNFLFLITFYYF